VREPSWFAAVLIFRGVAGPGSDDAHLTEWQLRLVQAVDAETAFERALQLGRDAALKYSKKAGARWDFLGLAELAEIDDAELRHGSEVLSTYSVADAELLTRPKEKLAVFWTADGERPARDRLDREEG
jgi:Domain of unknown function (DUF4288)